MMLRKLLRWTGKLPTQYKLLYPLWLSAQLDVLEEERFFSTLPPGLDGFAIAYASDIHHGPLLKKERVLDLVQRLNTMQADLVLLGGDYGEDTRTGIAMFEGLPSIVAKHGVFAAIGNHDRMGTAEEFSSLMDAMQAAGVDVLLNDARTLSFNNVKLCLCSVDDVKLGSPDFTPLLSPAKTADFTLFMPHSPDVLPLTTEYPSFHFDLCLAGHTHGGQLVMFGRSLHSSSRYGDRFRSGWMQHEGRDVLVSHGVGTSLLPLRIGARAQIHRITLRRKES